MYPTRSASQEQRADSPALQQRAATATLSFVMLSYLLLGIVALLPRLLDLGSFLTEDEANFWLSRSETFLHALQTGNFAATAVTDHPGVTTMWLGSAGILLRRGLCSAGIVCGVSFPTLLALMRLPGVLVHTGAILLGYHLLGRLVAPRIAFLGALLWAVDPFMIAYSRLLHVDALLATFGFLSVLAACCYWYRGFQRGMLVLSGVCAALAILSKSPGMALVPFVAAVAVWAALRRGEAPWHVRTAVLPVLGWILITTLAALAFWPALWAGPLRAYEQIRVGVVVEGAQPHQLGNFFLGRQDAAPGLLYYPAAVALRLTPVTLVGLLLLPWAWRRAGASARPPLAALALYALLMIVALSLFPKKFNRYVVPAFPALDVLAAAGLVWNVDHLAGLRNRLRSTTGKFRVDAVLAAIALAAVINVAWWHPYSIAAFNQLLGGARAGAGAFMVGWGEGLEQVAAWLNQQPDITGVITATTIKPGLQSYLRHGAQAVTPGETLPPRTGYVVIYNRHVQLGQIGPPFDSYHGVERPLHTVRIHGVDYAWIYQAQPPVATPLSAAFGSTIHFRGFTRTGEARRGQPLTFDLAWAPESRPSEQTMLFAHLLGPDNQRYAQVDLPLAAGWRPERYNTTPVPLTIPPDAPAGRYSLTIGLYDAQSGQRLPLKSSNIADPALDGPEVLMLTQLEVQ